MFVVKLEIVLNASVGSMLAMPSGLSGSQFWSVTIANVASHMNTFETSSDREYCFQSCASAGSAGSHTQQPEDEPLDRAEHRVEPGPLAG